MILSRLSRIFVVAALIVGMGASSGVVAQTASVTNVNSNCSFFVVLVQGAAILASGTATPGGGTVSGTLINNLPVTAFIGGQAFLSTAPLSPPGVPFTGVRICNANVPASTVFHATVFTWVVN